MREDFKKDPTNYIPPPDETEEETAEQETEGQETEGQNTEGQEETEGEETEKQTSTVNAPEEEAPGNEPTGSDPDKDSPAPASAKTARIADLESQLANLRQENTDLRTDRSHARRWPNLAYIPLPPAPRDGSINGGNDPTGNYDYSSWAAQFPHYHRLHPAGRMTGNDPERNITDAIGYARMKDAPIEAQNGQEVLDHSCGKWEYRRMLGAGGFGKVALWHKVDEADRVLDVSDFRHPLVSSIVVVQA